MNIKQWSMQWDLSLDIRLRASTLLEVALRLNVRRGQHFISRAGARCHWEAADRSDRQI